MPRDNKSSCEIGKRTGYRLSGIGDMRAGDHACCFYRSEQEFFDLIAEFLRTGLERGEKVLYVTSRGGSSGLPEYLSHFEPGTSPYGRSGQLTVLDVDEAYTISGSFDVDRTIGMLRGAIRLALDEGHSALRVTAEMTWAARELPGSDRLLDYEALVGELFCDTKAILLCQYDCRRFSPSLMLRVLNSHPLVAMGASLYENPFYVPGSKSSQATSATQDLHRCVNTALTLQQPKDELYGDNPDRDEAQALVPDTTKRLAIEIGERKKAEESLRVSQEMLTKAFRSSPCGIFLISLEDGCFIDLNESLLRMTGFDREELINQAIFGLNVLQDADQRHRLIKELLAYGQVRNFELSVRKKSGDLAVTRLSGETIKLNDKPHMLGTLLDLTDHLETEEALRETQRMLALKQEIARIFLFFRGARAYSKILRTIISAIKSKDGLFGSMDEHGSLICRSVHGEILSACQIKGKRPLIQPEKWGPFIEQAVREKRIVSVPRAAKPSAAHVPVRAAMIAPILQGTAVIGLIAVANKDLEFGPRDVNWLESVAEYVAPILQARVQEERFDKQRRTVERSLRESEQRLRVIFETADSMIFMKDKWLRYTHVNRCMERLLGQSYLPILGKKDADLYGPEAGCYLEAVDRRVLQGEVIEHQHTRSVGGTMMTVLETRAPITDSSGKIVGLCGIARNISERVKSKSTASISARSRRYRSPTMLAVMALADFAASTDSVVLLLGETGTGKDYLARYIHEHSKRSGGPFVTINSAAVPDTIAESELFGHEPGAFTGARRLRRGLLELAEGGTLLLNEIGELSLPLQAKLLEFLDTRSFRRVGGERKIPVNARLIAATNRDLRLEIAEKRFREDLFYRLNIVRIHVPPLRERLEDVPLIAADLLEQLADDLGLPRAPALDDSTMKTLTSYHWPGNIRELRNVLERFLLLSRGGRKIHIPEMPTPWPAAGSGEAERWPLRLEFPEKISVHDLLREVKRCLILEALSRSGGSNQRAARLLGISRQSFLRLRKSVGLGDRKAGKRCS